MIKDYKKAMSKRKKRNHDINFHKLNNLYCLPLKVADVSGIYVKKKLTYVETVFIKS